MGSPIRRYKTIMRHRQAFLNTSQTICNETGENRHAQTSATTKPRKTCRITTQEPVADTFRRTSCAQTSPAPRRHYMLSPNMSPTRRHTQVIIAQQHQIDSITCRTTHHRNSTGREESSSTGDRQTCAQLNRRKTTCARVNACVQNHTGKYPRLTQPVPPRGHNRRSRQKNGPIIHRGGLCLEEGRL